MSEDKKPVCLVCQRTEDEIPLIQMKYKGQDLAICPQHIPVLIHDPQKLVGMLDGAENFKGV